MRKSLTLRTSMAWPWSLPPCGTLGIELRLTVLAVLLAFAFIPFASASTIQSGPDIQEAISSASPGDVILVGPGEYNSFQVDKPLTIRGINGPMLHAAIQKPAIIIGADGVSISGFRVEGVGKDSESKFEYYMNNPAAAASMALNMPNAAIIVKGNDVRIENTTIFGAQVGVYCDTVVNLSLQNNTFESCGQGTQMLRCLAGRVDGCSFSNCAKSGIDAEQCSQMVFTNNSIVNTTHAGLMLKESDNCSVWDNLLSRNREGLAVWNSSNNDIRRNRADHSYYAIFLAGANNNTIVDNVAEKNSNPDVVGGFGMGISILENSSHNIVARNTARENFNGVELTKGCKFNAIYANNLSDNKHGIRLDKNYNNLVYGNNFVRNTISGYDNSSRTIWNTTFGNYYSDYQGKDDNGDGIGDQPYAIPKGDQDEMDARPLMRPFGAVVLDFDEIRAEVERYAKFGPLDEEIPVYRLSLIHISEPTRQR
ncbi:MAG: NosD domain-containing protein, partial [Methanotrichaceae archaeon]|nr:NosD domain-containing protein [Methanotrichaceae archaeon]